MTYKQKFKIYGEVVINKYSVHTIKLDISLSKELNSFSMECSTFSSKNKKCQFQSLLETCLIAFRRDYVEEFHKIIKNSNKFQSTLMNVEQLKNKSNRLNKIPSAKSKFLGVCFNFL
jgi:hypothetical protein